MATFNVSSFAQLSAAIAAASSNAEADIINLTGNIRLTAALPVINESNALTINGNGFYISGDANNNGINDAGDVRIFFVQNGTVNINGLVLREGRAEGTSPGGGGGAGMGGALFVYDGIVTVSNTTFLDNQAIGGNGGSASAINYGAGGGIGLGFLGNNGADGADGAPGEGSPGAVGGFGGTGGFGGDGSTGSGFGGSGFDGGDGGAGGFGGGGGAGGFGGGGFASGGDGGNGGAGNFGGGGGDGGFGGFIGGDGGNGGAGGYGGGGGKGGQGPGGNGVGGNGGFGGGDGSTTQGGGGAGMGGAVFIRSGEVTFTNSVFNNNTTTGGTGAENGLGLGGAVYALNRTDTEYLAEGFTNNLGLPSTLPTVNLNRVSFSGNDAGDAAGNVGEGEILPGTEFNNDDLFGFFNGIIGDPLVVGITAVVGAVEGKTGALTITRSDPFGTINVVLQFGGTATLGDDFTFGSGTVVGNQLTVTLLDGQTSVNVAINAIDDDKVSTIEGNETVTFTLLPSTIYNINPTQANGTATIFNNDFEISEGSVVGATVGTVPTALTGPSRTYTIVSGNLGNAFAVNPTTGRITIANPLDFETVSTYNLRVSINDGTATATETVTINVLDVSEPPVITNPDELVFNIDEDAANGTFIGQVIASDDEDDLAGLPLEYSIIGGNPGNVFAIDPVTGEITIGNNTNLNYETIQSYTLIVQVRDSDGLTTQTNVIIDINDVNEAPVITGPFTFAVNENTPANFLIGVVASTDSDIGQTRTYEIIGGNAGNAFQIDNSGRIRVANPVLDFETQPQYILQIRVTDNGVPPLSTIAAVTININDVNEAPVITNEVFDLSVDENSPNGTILGFIEAFDPDGTIPTFLEISGDVNNAFSVNPTTGAIFVSDSTRLDFEGGIIFYSLVVGATDGVNTAQRTFNITVNDVNEPPVISNPNPTFTINENANNGAFVGRVIATDPDFGQTLTFTILAGDDGGVFQIAPDGRITVANASLLDFETTASYALTVQIEDSGDPSEIVETTVTININDVNEAPVVVDGQSFNIDENSALSTVVGTVAASDPDGNPLTFSIISGNVGNVFSINAAGQILVNGALNFEVRDTYTLRVRASDGSLTDTSDITININNVNDAPVLADRTFSIVENSANGTLVGTVIGTDEDVGDTLTYRIIAGDPNGVFAVTSVGNAGEIRVANSALLDFETSPTFTLTVEVRDNGNPRLTDIATITINVTDINEAPVIQGTPLVVTIDENSLANGDLVIDVEALDDDGDTLTYEIIAGNEAGAFVINEDTGEITVANAALLDFELTSQYTLTIRVSDNNGAATLTDEAQVIINIANVNEAPTVSDATFNIDENSVNGTIVGTLDAVDDDGDTLIYTIVSDESGGAFAVNSSGQIVVADSTLLDFESTGGDGQFIVTVSVSDGLNPPVVSTVTVVVNDLNEAPVIVNDPLSLVVSLPEDSANGLVVIDIDAVDDDGDALIYSIVSGNNQGVFAINPSTGQITIADNTNLDFETTTNYSLVVQVSDGEFTDTVTVRINVTDVNEDPIVLDAVFSIDENSANGTLVGVIIASDPDAGQTLTYSISAGDPGGVFTIGNNGRLIVLNNTGLDYEALLPTGQFELTVDVSDGAGGFAQGSVVVRVNDINEAPVIDDAAIAAGFTIPENSANNIAVGQVIATDPDTGVAGQLSYAIIAGNLGNVFAIDNSGLITVANGSLLNFEVRPTYILTVRVSDLGTPSLSDTAQVVISVTDVNDAPFFLNPNPTFEVNENATNSTIVGVILASDEDGDALTYTITEGNIGVDAGGVQGPVFAINASGIITVLDTTRLNYENSEIYVLTIAVSDGVAQSTTTVTINVNDINEPPIFPVGNIIFSIPENATLGLPVGTPVTATDADDPTLTYAITGGNGDGIFQINASSGQLFIANPTNLNFEVRDRYVLTIQATDSDGLTATKQVVINITDVNEPPVITVQPLSVREDAVVGASVGFVSATDPDIGDSLTYSIIDGDFDSIFAINPATGEITIADNTNLDFESVTTYILRVQVQDTGGLTSQADVTINVIDVNEPPTFINTPYAFSVAENSAVGVAVGTVQATDPDSPTLTYQIVGGNTGGAFTINSATGVITVANSAALDFETTASYSLTVQVSDTGPGVLTDTTTVNITLIDVNEAPTITTPQPIPPLTLLNSSVNGTNLGVPFIATDPEGDALSYSIVGDPSGFAIDSATGVISVADISQLVGIFFTLTVQVSDGEFSESTLVLIIREGAVVFTGNANANSLTGTAADEIFFAGAGNDTIRAGNGNNVVYGEDGNDIIRAGTGNDLIFGGNGNDNIAVTGGNNTIYGGAGNDAIQAAGNGNNVIYGEDGDDVIRTGSGNDQIFGGDGNDDIRVTAGNNIIYGGAGNDLILASRSRTGNNIIFGEDGNDRIATGSGNDVIDGGAGNDLLYGGPGDDRLIGGTGNDILLGEAGNDILIGVDETTTLGRGEVDDLRGGAGSDLFVLGSAAGVFYNDGDPNSQGLQDYALIRDFQLGIDRIQLAGTAADYRIQNVTISGVNRAGIFWLGDNAVSGELIGFVLNLNSPSLNLNDAAQFQYV